VFPVQAGISFRQFSVLRYSIKGSFTNDVFLSAAIDRLGRSRGFGSPAFLRVGGSVSQPCPTRRYTRHGGIPLSDAGSCHSRVLRCDVSVLFTGGIWNTAGRSIRTATTPGGVQLECLPSVSLFILSRNSHLILQKAVSTSGARAAPGIYIAEIWRRFRCAGHAVQQHKFDKFA
jgi:hypothetical protein